MAEGGSRPEEVSMIASRPGISSNHSVTGMSGGTAKNCTICGENHGIIYVNDDVQKIEDKTLHDVSVWTEGMVRVSAVDSVVEKLEKGQNWITIIGNAGDGKTTVGYMVLKSLMRSGQKVFHINTPEEYFHVSESMRDCVIMLNDVFGAFMLDRTAIHRWAPVLEDILEVHEKMGMQTQESKEKLVIATQKKHVTSGKGIEVVLPQIRGYKVIAISRRNVLEDAKNNLDRFSDMILDTDGRIDLSDIKREEERLAILNNHLNRGNIEINRNVKQKIVSENTPHGFPHCCRMFVKLTKKGENIDIEQFFKSPLSFLNRTTKVYMEDDGIVELFKKMCKSDGALVDSDLSDGKERSAMLKLLGSYLTTSSSRILFSHPSVYESVIVTIGMTYPLFIVQHASLSVIMQKVYLKQNESDTLNGFVNLQPSSKVLDILCDRFQPLILKKDFSIVGNQRLCGNTAFCQRLIRCCFETWRVKSIMSKRLYIQTRDEHGSTLIHEAVKSGNLTAVPVLLECGVSVNKSDGRKRTALHLLCEKGDAINDVLNLLLKRGSEVNKADNYGTTPLLYLCQSGYADAHTVEMLIKHGADVKKGDYYGTTPLHYLCKSDKADANTLGMLISHGAEVNKGDDYGTTPLLYLCQSGKADANIVEMLIKHGADVNKAETYGRPLLLYLCESGKADANTVEMLISHGADVNKADYHGTTPLHCLCKSDKAGANTAEILISHGADVNKPDIDGTTPLHCLCKSGNADANTVEMLIRHGVDVKKVDRYGTTPLHCLCESANADANTVEMLIKHGADVNKVDIDGTTPLHCLCKSGKADANTVEMLIKHGADVTKADVDGTTPLHHLCQSGNADANTVEMLIKHGADVKKADVDGATPLHRLCESGKADASTVEMLIKHGADVNKAGRYGATPLFCLWNSGNADANTVEMLIKHW